MVEVEDTTIEEAGMEETETATVEEEDLAPTTATVAVTADHDPVLPGVEAPDPRGEAANIPDLHRDRGPDHHNSKVESPPITEAEAARPPVHVPAPDHAPDPEKIEDGREMSDGNYEKSWITAKLPTITL